MSVLYFDLGNTSLKVFNGQGFIKDFSSLEKEWLSKLGEFLAGSYITRVVIASVAVEEKLDALYKLIEGLSVKDIVVANCSEGDWSVAHSYYYPERLGIDRLLAIESAYREVKDSCLVIDCGSAITIDAVDECGKHLGGYIVPGFRLQMESLLGGTNLSFSEIEPGLSMGLDTSECIRHGSLRMIMSFCESVIADIKPTKVYVTGGDLKGVLAPLKNLGVHDDLLVYKGLKSLYG